MDQSQDLLESARPYVQTAWQRTKKLPLFTLGISAAMILFWLLSFVSPIFAAFSLKPSDLRKFEMSRLTTYPLIHASSIQFLISIVAFVPLCTRFEQKFGTLRSLAMFLGPFESVPGLLYSFIDGFILRQDGVVSGCSVFAFVLLTIESSNWIGGKGSKQSVVIAGRAIPVYAAPFLVLVLTTIFLPGGSFLCHSAAIGMGLVFASGRVNFLLLPLKVVNFVEVKGERLIVLIPNYITAESAQADFDPLPTTEPGGFTLSNMQSSTASRFDEEGSDSLGSLRSTSPNPLVRPESGRPSGARQASSTWPASQRED